MFSDEEVAQFGWKLVCRAVRDHIQIVGRPVRAFELAKMLGWGLGRRGSYSEAINMVTTALRYLEAEGEPVDEAGGWWRWTKPNPGIAPLPRQGRR